MKNATNWLDKIYRRFQKNNRLLPRSLPLMLLASIFAEFAYKHWILNSTCEVGIALALNGLSIRFHSHLHR